MHLTRAIKRYFDLGTDAAYQGWPIRPHAGTVWEHRAWRMGYMLGVAMALERDMWEIRKRARVQPTESRNGE